VDDLAGTRHGRRDSPDVSKTIRAGFNIYIPDGYQIETRSGDGRTNTKIVRVGREQTQTRCARGVRSSAAAADAYGPIALFGLTSETSDERRDRRRRRRRRHTGTSSPPTDDATTTTQRRPPPARAARQSSRSILLLSFATLPDERGHVVYGHGRTLLSFYYSLPRQNA